MKLSTVAPTLLSLRIVDVGTDREGRKSLMEEEVPEDPLRHLESPDPGRLDERDCNSRYEKSPMN